MPIETICPHCKTRFKGIPDSYGGADVKCRSCGEVFNITPVDAEPPERIAIVCPDCGRRSDSVPARLAGKTVRCRDCSHSFIAQPVDEDEGAVAEAPPAAAPAPPLEAEAPQAEYAPPAPPAAPIDEPTPPPDDGFGAVPPTVQPVQPPDQIDSPLADQAPSGPKTGAELPPPPDDFFDGPPPEVAPVQPPDEAPGLEASAPDDFFDGPPPEAAPVQPPDEAPSVAPPEPDVFLDALPSTAPARSAGVSPDQLSPEVSPPLADAATIPAGVGVDPKVLPIVARLEEIHRKCQSIEPRPDELESLSNKLEPVILALKTAHGAQANYGELAAPLRTMPATFEQLGLASLAREIEYVDRALHGLGGDGEPAAVDRPPAAVPEPRRPATRRPRPAEAPKSKGLSKQQMLIFGTMFVVVAVIGAALIVFSNLARRSDSQAQTTDPITTAPARPTAAPTAVAAFPTERPEPTGPSLADLVSEARVGLQAGNVDDAVFSLSRAALLEPRHPLVLDTAREIIIYLMESADTTLRSGNSSSAERSLERARNLALRFGFPPTEMDRKLEEIHARDSGAKIKPTDTATMRSLTGTQIQVNLKDGSTREGLLTSASREKLSLEIQTKVGTGYVKMTHTMAIETIESIQKTD